MVNERPEPTGTGVPVKRGGTTGETARLTSRSVNERARRISRRSLKTHKRYVPTSEVVWLSPDESRISTETRLCRWCTTHTPTPVMRRSKEESLSLFLFPEKRKPKHRLSEIPLRNTRSVGPRVWKHIRGGELNTPTLDTNED